MRGEAPIAKSPNAPAADVLAGAFRVRNGRSTGAWHRERDGGLGARHGDASPTISRRDGEAIRKGLLPPANYRVVFLRHVGTHGDP
jgi:hypothetical protein